MEELRQIAMTYYKTAPVEIRVKVDELFDTMDVNKDGTISFFEFSSFMSEEGFSLFNNPSFFDEISSEKSNDLNWQDVVTLFYMLQSGRPLCGGCRRLIKDTYFTCETCFKGNGSCFDLHPDCLAKKQYIHKHINFIDNFALLHLSRKKRLSDMRPAQVPNESNASISSPQPVEVIHDVPNYSNTSNSSPQPDAVIRDVQVVNPNVDAHRKRKAAFKALDTMITVASIASNCTTM